MKNIRKIGLLLFFFMPLLLFSQKKMQIEIPTYTNLIKMDNGYLVSGIVVDGDTFPHVKLYQIVVFPERKFTSKRKQKKYTRLVHNLKKVYPYAVLIGEYYHDIERDLAYIPNERDQKKYIKKKEKELKKQYEETLINLTITQGRLLIKLVDRQTDHTTYEVVKEFKGDMSAFFWQSIAVLFGSNLKTDYDATEEDKMIEEIIAQIENGQL